MNHIKLFEEFNNKKYTIGTESNAKKYLENKDYINIKFEFVMKNLISNFIVIFYK
jgi:hypothetical protein